MIQHGHGDYNNRDLVVPLTGGHPLSIGLFFAIGLTYFLLLSCSLLILYGNVWVTALEPLFSRKLRVL